MAEPLIRYKDVEVHQQDLCVLNEVNLELQKGEFVYLIGKVGSGKTSLLKTLYENWISLPAKQWYWGMI